MGLTLPLVLARYGVAALVLEAREAPTPPDESRAITWMPKGLELLDWLELGERFDSCCSRAWKFGLRWLVNGRAV